MAVTSSLKDLIESGAHFGHQTRRWNPKMEEFLHGSQEGVHIFDLFKTKEALDEALSVITKAAKDNKTILIVGTKKQAKDKLVEIAKEAGIFYVDERWLGGTITNFDQIKNSTRKLAEMKASKAAGEYKSRTKKERLLIDREIARLTRFFGGVAEMEKIPDLLIVIDIKREAGAVKEARMKGVTTIAVVDSNCDPEMVDFAIPMNDDATSALHYVLELIKEAVLAGKGKTGSRKVKKVNKKSKKDDKKNPA